MLGDEIGKRGPAMDHETIVELLGRAAAIEFAIGSIIKHLPDEARQTVQDDIKAFMERSDLNHPSGKATADAALSILKESAG